MLKSIYTIIQTIHMKPLLRYTSAAVVLTQISCGSTYTLDGILASIEKEGSLSKRVHQENLALEARNKSQNASDPLELYLEGTRAVPIIGKEGNEYAVGLSKNIKLGSIQAQEEKITRLSNQAYLLEQEKNILDFKNSIKNSYHQHCLDKQSYSSFSKNYQDFVKLYKKKQKAYQYQEISKVELMQLEIEKNSLYTQLQEHKLRQETSKKNLFMLSEIAYESNAKLACKDIYPIRVNVQLGEQFRLSNEAHEKRIKSTLEALDRYATPVDSINLSAQYTDELDIDRYTVGLSIPLNFTSSKNEQARAAAMYENSAIALKHEHMMIEKRSLLMQLQSHLKSHALTLKSLQKNYNSYQKDLLPLMKKSYDLGEISVVEYLLTRKRSHQFREEIYDTKKAYYEMLFKLYTLTENKDN